MSDLAQRILAAVERTRLLGRAEQLAAINAVLAEPRATALRRLAVAAYDESMGTGKAETHGDAQDATEDAVGAVIDACGDRASADAWIDSLRSEA